MLPKLFLTLTDLSVYEWEADPIESEYGSAAAPNLGDLVVDVDGEARFVDVSFLEGHGVERTGPHQWNPIVHVHVNALFLHQQVRNELNFN